MDQILRFIIKVFINIRSLEAFKNPWTLPVAALVIIMAFITVFINTDFESMSSFRGLLRVLLK